MNKVNNLNCFACVNPVLYVEYHLEVDENCDTTVEGYCVECIHCLARGPVADTEEDAIRVFRELVVQLQSKALSVGEE